MLGFTDTLDIAITTFIPCITWPKTVYDVSKVGVKVFVVVGDVNEELAGCGVRLTRICHGYRAVVIDVVVAYLVRNGRNINALVLSTLNHEASDDSVEDGAIVEALLHQVHEIPRCNRLVVSHLNDYVAHGSYEENLCPICAVFTCWRRQGWRSA